MQTSSNRINLSADAPNRAGSTPSPAAIEKERELRSWMRQMQRVLVAYSGGVDSSYLAYIASSELGSNVLCILGMSPSVSSFQHDEALATVAALGLNFREVHTNEIQNELYAANPTNRCYFCKSELYDTLASIAENEHYSHIVDGTNADDLTGHRPGRIAASEHTVESPLAMIGLTKAEIRDLSRSAGIPGWDKPAAPCLASRIAYGTTVTIERLSKVERGEEFLRRCGFREFRVRVHSDLVRLEIAPNEIERALDPNFTKLAADEFSRLGFKYVTLDLKGFRSGSMNEILS